METSINRSTRININSICTCICEVTIKVKKVKKWNSLKRQLANTGLLVDCYVWVDYWNDTKNKWNITNRVRLSFECFNIIRHNNYVNLELIKVLDPDGLCNKYLTHTEPYLIRRVSFWFNRKTEKLLSVVIQFRSFQSFPPHSTKRVVRLTKDLDKMDEKLTYLSI